MGGHLVTELKATLYHSREQFPENKSLKSPKMDLSLHVLITMVAIVFFQA